MGATISHEPTHTGCHSSMGVLGNDSLAPLVGMDGAHVIHLLSKSSEPHRVRCHAPHTCGHPGRGWPTPASNLTPLTFSLTFSTQHERNACAARIDIHQYVHALDTCLPVCMGVECIRVGGTRIVICRYTISLDKQRRVVAHIALSYHHLILTHILLVCMGLIT